MPSSNTAKSRCSRSVTKLLRESVTERLRLMISICVPKIGPCGCCVRAWPAACGGSASAAASGTTRARRAFIEAGRVLALRAHVVPRQELWDQHLGAGPRDGELELALLEVRNARVAQPVGRDEVGGQLLERAVERHV